MILTLLAPHAIADETLTGVHGTTTPYASATWGHLVSSQLNTEEPTAFWSLALDLPLLESHGLSTQLRFDSIVFGDTDRLLSKLVHPGRTDYSIGARWMVRPWIGVEAHHVSSHAVSILHDGQKVDFEDEVTSGGASNFVSLLLHSDRGELRVGVGGQWTDTNTAPILMGFEGVLLNSRTASGPFLAVQVPVLRPTDETSTRMDFNAFFVADRGAGTQYRYQSSYLSWAIAAERPVHRRVALGLAYAGNNGSPGVKRANNVVNVYFKLRWRVEG